MRPLLLAGGRAVGVVNALAAVVAALAAARRLAGLVGWDRAPSGPVSGLVSVGPVGTSFARSLMCALLVVMRRPRTSPRPARWTFA